MTVSVYFISQTTSEMLIKCVANINPEVVGQIQFWTVIIHYQSTLRELSAELTNFFNHGSLWNVW
jgi:hypothetical protein